MPDNHNAGIHFIRWSHNYDNLKYYDNKAAQLQEKARKKKEKFENEQKLAYELEIESIKDSGYKLIDIFYLNLAYEAFIKDFYLMKAIDDVERFIEEHNPVDDNMLGKALFRFGMLSDLMNVPIDKLFMDNIEKIEAYFEKYVVDAINNGEYEIEKNNIFNPNSEEYISIDVYVTSSFAELYVLKQNDSVYSIDIAFKWMTGDLQKKRAKNSGGGLYINIVNSRSVELSRAYTKALNGR